MSSLISDVRLALRQTHKRPGLTAVAVATLALGIGASTAVFSVVNGVLLSALPFPEPERLSFLTREGDVSILDAVDWRRESRSFEEIALFLRTAGFDFSGADHAERLTGAVVEPQFFSVLRMAPLLGRTLNADDNRVGGARVAVVSEGFWRRRLGSDPRVIGRKITLSDHPTEIVGVMPDALDFLGDEVELWTPAAVEVPWAVEERGTNNFDAIGRLRPGVSIDAARAEMVRITTRLAEEYPKTNARKIVEPLGMLDFITGNVRRALFVLLGAVVLVVLLASVNLAGLLLARSATRQQEFAVRRALGASRGRIARQLLTEGLLLSILGGGLGVLLAFWSSDLLLAAAPETLPRASGVAIDSRVLLFSLASTVFVGLVFSLVPAAYVLRVDPAAHLAVAGKGTPGVPLRRRLLASLVTAEVSLAFLLLVGAGLLLRTFDRLQRVPLGFERGNVLVGQLVLPEARYAEPAQQTAAFRGIVEGVSQLPGVEAAAFAIGSLLEPGSGIGNKVLVEGRPESDTQVRGARARPVLGDYFEALRLPIREGRTLTALDDERASHVGVVNQRFARDFFPGESPIGKRIAWRDWRRADDTHDWMTIVGVCADVKAETLQESDSPAVYTPYVQRMVPWLRFGTLIVRTRNEPMELLPAIRRAVLDVDKTQPLGYTTTLQARFRRASAESRFNAAAASTFGAAALALALQGLFAVLAFAVAERRREIGVRMALGATPADILGLVVRVGMGLTGVGLALGALGALALQRVLSGLLYEVTPTDPMTFLGAAFAFAVTAFVAIGIPASRAAGTDPMHALRAD